MLEDRDFGVGLFPQRGEILIRRLAASPANWRARQQSTATAARAGEQEHEVERWTRNETLVIAAVIGARDGGAELIAQHEDWIRATLTRALKTPADPVHRVREGLQFNLTAIAFVGWFSCSRIASPCRRSARYLRALATRTLVLRADLKCVPPCSPRSMSACLA